MKRRDQGISSAWSFLLGFVLLTLVVPGVLIGPARAVRLIASAVSTTVMQHADPVAETTAQSHKLPVVELLSSEKELVHNNIHHSIELEGSPRDEVIVHFQTPGNAPFGPYERVSIAPPPGRELLGGQLAIWVAGRMGVPVAYKDLIFLRHDGRDAGIRELTETVSEAFEQYRHISDGPVSVFTMRTAPTTEEAGDPWRDPTAWEYPAGTAKSSIARLNGFLAVLNDTLITNADRRVAIDGMIDVDAFNRYHAALHMLGANDEAQVRMALVLNPRTEKFYPVLTDAPLVPATGEVILSRERDLLTERMMAISDWRAQRDRYVRQALEELHTNGAFEQRMAVVSEQVGPSLTTAGRSRRPLFSMQDPDHSVAALQHSAGDLKTRVSSYWDRLRPVVQDDLGIVNVNMP